MKPLCLLHFKVMHVPENKIWHFYKAAVVGGLTVYYLSLYTVSASSYHFIA